MVIEGIKTTIPLHKQIMADERFQKGDFSTKFMEEFTYKVDS
jgi:acetyl-CoA carboxylase biotin carboxylase subunit